MIHITFSISAASASTATTASESHSLAPSVSSHLTETATSKSTMQHSENISAPQISTTQHEETNVNLDLQLPTTRRNNNNIIIETVPQNHPTTTSVVQASSTISAAADESVAAALKDIKMAIQATRVLQHQSTRIPHPGVSPTSTMGSAINNRNATTMGSVIMNGSTIPISQVSNISEGNTGILPTTAINNTSQIMKTGSQIPITSTTSEPISSDPWVPRNNVVPNLLPVSSLGTQSDIQESGVATQSTLVASSSDKSIQNSAATIALSNSLNNTSQAVQTVGQPSVIQQTTTSSLPISSKSSSTSNGTAVLSSSDVTSHQPTNTPSLKDPSKSHNVLMGEAVGTEKGAGRRDMIHTQDINIDDDVEDIDEDEEEDDEEDDELEDEESESELGEERVPTPKNLKDTVDDDLDTDQETDRLLGQQYNDDNGYYDSKVGLNFTFFGTIHFYLFSLFQPSIANIIFITFN